MNVIPSVHLMLGVGVMKKHHLPQRPIGPSERAARAILSEFDDRGAAMNEALHPEKVDEDIRKEIIVVMAAIIRQAAKARS